MCSSDRPAYAHETHGVIIERGSEAGIGRFDKCVLCGDLFEEDDEVFVVVDHHSHQRVGMHTWCVVSACDQHAENVASNQEFERYRRKLLREAKREKAATA